MAGRGTIHEGGEGGHEMVRGEQEMSERLAQYPQWEPEVVEPVRQGGQATFPHLPSPSPERSKALWHVGGPVQPPEPGHSEKQPYSWMLAKAPDRSGPGEAGSFLSWPEV